MAKILVVMIVWREQVNGQWAEVSPSDLSVSKGRLGTKVWFPKVVSECWYEQLWVLVAVYLANLCMFGVCQNQT
jgi:hypothetical protein